MRRRDLDNSHLLRPPAALALALTLLCALLAPSALASPPTFKETIAKAGTKNFKQPWGMTTDAAGDLYVADPEAKLLDQFSPTGAFLGTIGSGLFAEEFARSVAVSTLAATSGELYVGESGKEEVFVFKPLAGSYSKVQQVPFFNFSYLAFDNSAGSHSGDLYVTWPKGEFGEVKVVPTDAEGKLALAAGQEAPSLAPPPEGFSFPGKSSNDGLAVDASTATLFIANSRRHTVDLYDTDTPSASEVPTFVRAITGAGTPAGAAAFEPVGVAVDESTGLVYVIDAAEAAVDVFSPSGTYEGRLEETGGGSPFPFSGPRGVAVQNAAVPGRGQVYVSDGTHIDVFNPGSSGVTRHTLTLAKSGGGQGSVTSAPPGISCGAACAGQAFEFGAGETVTLTATAAEHSVFGGWHGAAAQAAGCDPSGATASCEVVIGADLEVEATFTHIAEPASIDGLFATEVLATAATLAAQIDPHGLATSYRFQYGPTAAYGSSVPFPAGSAGAGEADVLRAVQIQGLAPATTYHYRLVLENGLGPVTSPDQAFTTEGPASQLLADGRQWELVSPPDKHGAILQSLTEEGGVIEAAADGDAFTYVGKGSVLAEPPAVLAPAFNQFLATRGEGTWTNADITPPREEVQKVVPGTPAEYRQFAPGLETSIVEPAASTPLSAQAGERTPYQRLPGGFAPLVSAANVPAGTHIAAGQGVEFRTATPDLGHILLESPNLLTDEFAPGFQPGALTNIYEETAGRLRLVSILPDGEGVSEAGMSAGVGWQSKQMNGALSADGNRIVFEATSGGPNSPEGLYLRDMALGQSLRLDAPQGGAPGGNAHAVYQGADQGASRIFFSDEARLTPDSTAAETHPDLYMCQIQIAAGALSCRLTDLSVDPHPGETATVQNDVSAIDPSGRRVYFAADGVLTGPNARGESPVPGDCASPAEGSCNLYEYDTESAHLSLLAVLSSHDDPDWGGRTDQHFLGNLSARISPDGRWFTFMSLRPLTGYDNRDALTGERDEEVYLYDAESGSLRCVSCDPTGARPHGVLATPSPGLLVDHPLSWLGRRLAGMVPGWTLRSLNVATYQSRYLGESGRLFFDSPDALAPEDNNGLMDVYEYEPPGVGDCAAASPRYASEAGGCIALISSGTSSEESAFLDASESGDDVFFLTASGLSARDFDGAFDVYDARVGGGEAPAPEAVVCSGDACQSPPPPPAFTTPRALGFQGAGNLRPTTPRKKHKRHRRHHKKHRSARRAVGSHGPKKNKKKAGQGR
jgi:DNA-binding beta-propeller fold protein YncE